MGRYIEGNFPLAPSKKVGGSCRPPPISSDIRLQARHHLAPHSPLAGAIGKVRGAREVCNGLSGTPLGRGAERHQDIRNPGDLVASADRHYLDTSAVMSYTA